MTWLLTLALSSVSAAPPAPSTEVPMSELSALTLVRLDGTPLPAAELAGKVVLFVNVASKCGYTPQYDGLEKLWASRKDRGLVIVGVPCNQFGGQEPGAPEEIATFCKLNYGVTFPVLEKQDVNGAGRSALYGWLVGSPTGAGADVKWNFEKFLVGRARFGSKVTPESAELVAAVDRALGGS